jgi:hypothetical protein
VTLVVILLITFLVAGQLVRRWSAPVIAGLTAWIAFVVAVHLAFLR